MNRRFPIASVLAGLALGLLVLLPVTGCESGQYRRTLSPIKAERDSMEHTKNYAGAYVEKFPAEKQEVEDFYDAWEDRLKAEEADAPDAVK